MHAPDSASLVARFDIRPVLLGLLLGVTTLLFGFGLGAVFGLNEEAIKAKLTNDGTAVLATVYEGDEARIRSVVNGSFTYLQRAHLHAGGLGAVAVALSLVLVLLGTSATVARVVSGALGFGAFGYSTFWMWAGFRAPGLGSTGAAKESLAWYAIPSSGLVIVGTTAVLVLLAMALFKPKRSL